MVVGIIGKTGAGKSFAASYLKSKGWALVDLDILGKELPLKYPQIIKEIAQEFGEEMILIRDGKKYLNRKALGDLVFKNKKKLAALNQIFFPFFEKEVEQIINNGKNILIDGVILFEANLNRFCDKTIFIDASDHILLTRLKQRDNFIQEETLKNRIKVQAKYEKLKDKVDFVVENNKTIDDFKKQLAAIVERWNN